MKTIEETLLNRTSVRRYEYDKIPSETLDFIYRAIANTPTSYNGQQFSVIAIDDQSIKVWGVIRSGFLRVGENEAKSVCL